MFKVIVHPLRREEKTYGRMQEIRTRLPIDILRIWDIAMLNRPANTEEDFRERTIRNQPIESKEDDEVASSEDEPTGQHH